MEPLRVHRPGLGRLQQELALHEAVQLLGGVAEADQSPEQSGGQAESHAADLHQKEHQPLGAQNITGPQEHH